MDLTSAWFLLVVVVLGGIVSVLADNLGRHLGKKKLKWGRMRPRHTAMVFTALTGMLVTLFTILLVSALSAEVRIWIIKGRGLDRENKALEKVNAQYKTNLNETKAFLNDARTQLANLKKSQQKLQSQLTELQSKVSEAQNKASSAQSKERIVSSQLAKSSRGLAIVTSNRNALQHQISGLDTTLTTLKRTSSGLNKINGDLMKSNFLIEGKLQSAESELKSKNVDLESVKKNLQEALAEAKEAQEDAKKAQEQVSLSQGQLEQLQRDIARANLQLAAARNQSRVSPMIFHRGEVFARRQVEAITDPFAANDEVIKVLAAARKTAEDRGATANSAGQMAGFQALDIGNGLVSTPEAQQNEVVQRIIQQPGPKLLVVLAPLNAFEGEFVPVQVDVYPNPIVFKLGEMIAETRASGTDQEIIAQIKDLVVSKVRDRAREKGMIILEGFDSIGEVPLDDIIPLVNAIKKENKPVRVQALAQADTRAAGPLKIAFKVR